MTTRPGPHWLAQFRRAYLFTPPSRCAAFARDAEEFRGVQGLPGEPEAANSAIVGLTRNFSQPVEASGSPMRPTPETTKPITRWTGFGGMGGGRPVSCHGHSEASLTTGHTLLAISLADGARTSGTQAPTVAGAALASAATSCRLSRHRL